MKSSIVLSVIFATASLATAVHAAVVTPGNVVILRVGDGSAALTSAATAEYLDEYSRAGVAAQSVALSTSSTARVTDSGSATSDGQITLNNGVIGVAGYDAAVGTAGVASSTAAAVPRRYLGFNVAADLATSTPTLNSSSTTAYSGTNFRSVTTDGTNSYGAGGNTGTIYLPTTTTVQATVTNTRVVNAFNSNLYFTTGSGTKGVYVVAGAPTTTGNTASLLLTDAAGSPYGFSISPDGKTVFVADDTVATGGVQKYTSTDGATFTLAYTVNTDGDGAGTVQTNGARGLSVDWTTAGGATVFATTAETTNRLISFVDSGTAAAPAFSTLATAATNEAFRGVVVTPNAATANLPEPASLAAIGSLALVGLRRRRAR